MNELDSLKDELLSETQKCKELFDSKILTKHPLFAQSAFIEILIRLDYILQKLSKNNSRIIWADDIQTDQNIGDITDLVNKLRNAVCHVGSRTHYISNSDIKFDFNRIFGKGPNAVQIGDFSSGCEYEDDIAFYYGDKRIYLRRHIKRLLDELSEEINKLKSIVPAKQKKGSCHEA